MRICEEKRAGESAIRQISRRVRSANGCGIPSYAMGRMGHSLWRRCQLTAAICLGAAALVCTLPSFAQQNSHPNVQLFTLVHPAMGTDFTLYIYAADDAQAGREAELVFDIVDRLEGLLSTYQPQSARAPLTPKRREH